MKAAQMFDNALKLLGYSENQILKSKAIAQINAIYSDLHYNVSENAFIPIAIMSDEIHFPNRIANDVMLYGVAMLIAQGENDGDNQQLWECIYSRKRKALCKIDKIKDIIPGVD